MTLQRFEFTEAESGEKQSMDTSDVSMIIPDLNTGALGVVRTYSGRYILCREAFKELNRRMREARRLNDDISVDRLWP